MKLKKLLYVFAVTLIALIMTPNAIMGVSACADFEYACDDDCVHLTLSDILANIDPKLAEIDFDALIADAAQYEGDFFIVISMQEVYGQIDVLSVEVVNEYQLGLLICTEEVGLLILPLNAPMSCPCIPTGSCPCANFIFIGHGAIWCQCRATHIHGFFHMCLSCQSVRFDAIYR